MIYGKLLRYIDVVCVHWSSCYSSAVDKGLSKAKIKWRFLDQEMKRGKIVSALRLVFRVLFTAPKLIALRFLSLITGEIQQIFFFNPWFFVIGAVNAPASSISAASAPPLCQKAKSSAADYILRKYYWPLRRSYCLTRTRLLTGQYWTETEIQPIKKAKYCPVPWFQVNT